MNITTEIEDSINKGIERLGEGFKIDPTIFIALISRKKCPHCKRRFSEPLVLPGDGKFNPNPRYLVHVQETHGIPAEMEASSLFFLPYRNSSGETALNYLFGDLIR